MKRLLLIICLIMSTGCSNRNEQTTITVSAAASLKDALTDIAKNYEKTHPHINIVYNFGGSGTLANQIQSGAPADLFFSASNKEMNRVIAANAIHKKNTVSVLTNQLVIVSQQQLFSPEELSAAHIRKIAVGTPETVPAGMYAKSALTEWHLWSQLTEKFVFTKDVRQVLTYVESGNVDAGIVYQTDALTSELNRYPMGDKRDTPITYPLGIVTATKHFKEAQNFYNYLQSNQSKKVYDAYGFIVNS